MSSGPRPQPRAGLCGAYFVRWGNFVKIGSADNVVKRRRALEVSVPEGEMVPLGWIPSVYPIQPSDVEADAHRALQAHRVRGEWFTHGDAVRAYIAKYAQMWPE